MTKDAVYYAIRREYRSQRLNLQREQEHRDELSAKLKGCDLAIANARTALTQLEAFARETGWELKMLE